MFKALRWLLLGSFLASLLVSIGFAVFLFSGLSGNQEGVLTLRIAGSLNESPNQGLDSLLGEEILPDLRETTFKIRHAASDERITGLVLDIEQAPDGLAQIQEFSQAMDAFRESGKPSFAFLESAGEGGSGNAAYWLAITADKVILAPPGDINIEALQSNPPFMAKLFERLGITPYFDARHEYKTAVNMFTQSSLTEAHRETLKRVLDDIQNEYIKTIATRRSVDVATATQWIKTGPVLGEAALEAGMVDQLAYWDQAWNTIREATESEDTVKIAEYEPEFSGETTDKTIAIIYGLGQVQRGGNREDGISEDAMYSNVVTQAFRDAREDEVDGVLFRVNSPGGSYVASDLIRREVQLTRDAEIPVVVSMGDLAASGGYFVSMDANRIVAQPSTLTGSIGVFAGTFATRKFWNDFVGITFDKYQVFPDAQAGLSALDPPDESQKAMLSGFMDRIYDDFTTKVGNARNKTAEEMDTLARGRVWTGNQALENGLVDALGGVQDAAADLKELMGIERNAVVNAAIYPKPKSTMEQLRDLLRMGISISAMVETFERQQQQIRALRSGDLYALPVTVQ